MVKSVIFKYPLTSKKECNIFYTYLPKGYVVLDIDFQFQGDHEITFMVWVQLPYETNTQELTDRVEFRIQPTGIWFQQEPWETFIKRIGIDHNSLVFHVFALEQAIPLYPSQTKGET